MALHTEDLELFKKILSIDGKLIIQALNIDSLYISRYYREWEI